MEMSVTPNGSSWFGVPKKDTLPATTHGSSWIRGCHSFREGDFPLDSTGDCPLLLQGVDISITPGPWLLKELHEPSVAGTCDSNTSSST